MLTPKQYAQRLLQVMNSRRPETVSVRGLADAVRQELGYWEYEDMRKVLRGRGLPPRPVHEALCDALGLDPETLERVEPTAP